MLAEIDDSAPGADASNWRTSPFNRWAFHNVRAILPTAQIEAAPGNVLVLPDAPVSLEGFQLALPGGASLDLPTFLNATATDALVILREGQVAFEFYAGGNTRHTPHILMSSSKAVTGLIAGVLQMRGLFDVDKLASDYVPEIGKTGYRGVTIRQLLDMRAGVVLDEAQSRDYDAAVHRKSAAADDAAPGLHAVLETLITAKAAHGGSFRYISANTDLVGWAMERATGKRFAALVSELLWKPMGAEDAGNVIVDREGSPWCSGGISATARDFARMGDLLVNDGRRGAADVVPKAWIDDLIEGGDAEAWKTGEWGEAFALISRNIRYRAGWYAVHDTPTHLFAMGVHGQNLFIDRASGIVIAKLSSQASRIDPQAIFLTHRAVPELTRCVLGQ